LILLEAAMQNSFANEQLEISIAGSGDITYTGSPHVVQSVAGSGDIKQVD
jgi:hypothetical protein